MPRSVTRTILIISLPLLAVTTVSAVGSRPSHVPASAASRPARAATVAFLRPRHAGMIAIRQAVPTAVPAPASAGPPPAPVVRPRPAPSIAAVGGAAGVQFSLVNQDRVANGAASLSWSGSLARVAQYRAQDMLNRNYFSHYDPATGQLAFVQLMHLWGIPYTSAGENIAWSTSPSMAAINTMFMNSPEHRANILSGAYHRAGIGVASNGGRTMVVEVFSN